MNMIYRGPLSDQPRTETLKVSGAYLPGTAIGIDGTQLTSAGNDRVLILSNREFYDQDLTKAYATDDTGIAYRPRGEDEFAVAMAAGTYAKGDALTVGAAGRFTAAAAGDRVVAFFDQSDATVAAGDIADVVIALGFVAA